MDFKKAILISFLAFTLIAQATGVRVLLEYGEPATNMDGSQITDLKSTIIYYDFIDDTNPPVKALTIPATSPNGGGQIKKNIVIPMQPNALKRLVIWATAVDTSGNESQKSNILNRIEGIVHFEY